MDVGHEDKWKQGILPIYSTFNCLSNRCKDFNYLLSPVLSESQITVQVTRFCFDFVDKIKSFVYFIYFILFYFLLLDFAF